MDKVLEFLGVVPYEPRIENLYDALPSELKGEKSTRGTGKMLE